MQIFPVGGPLDLIHMKQWQYNLMLFFEQGRNMHLPFDSLRSLLLSFDFKQSSVPHLPWTKHPPRDLIQYEKPSPFVLLPGPFTLARLVKTPSV